MWAEEHLPSSGCFRSAPTLTFHSILSCLLECGLRAGHMLADHDHNLIFLEFLPSLTCTWNITWTVQPAMHVIRHSKRSNIPLIKSSWSSWFALPGPALQNLCTAQWVGTGVGVISGKTARDSHCSYSTLSNLSNVNASWVVVLLCCFLGV